MKWDVFISYASEDMEAVAKPLAYLLQEKGVKVWLDKLEVSLGDSIHQSIEEGLSRSRFAIVILSKSFFEKYWTMNELNALFSREEVDDKVILPIWHNITLKQVRRHSPILSDRLALQTESGLENIATAIKNVVANTNEHLRYKELKKALEKETNTHNEHIKKIDQFKCDQHKQTSSFYDLDWFDYQVSEDQGYVEQAHEERIGQITKEMRDIEKKIPIDEPEK